MRHLLLALLPTFCFAQEHARILDRTTTYTVFDDGSAEIQDTYKIRINTKEGGQRHGVYYDYFDKYRRITDIKVEIYSQKDERVKRLKRSDGYEFSFNQDYEITDAKILVINPDYQQYPYTLAVNSTVKLNGFLSLPSWTPRDAFNLAVDRAVLHVRRPASVSLKFREENITGKQETNKGMIVSSYEVSNLSHVERKFRYQDFFDAQSTVLVSPETFKYGNSKGSMANWTVFGEWFLDLNDKPFTLTAETMKFIDRLDKTDQHKLVRSVYQYMQDKTRYVSIQLGIGGYQSLPTEDVEKYGYGDCKALSTYMRNMLKYAGIPSNYVLVMAGRDERDIKADFPSNQFNHVFLAVPLERDTIMLECTSQTSPSDFTGTFTDDRNVLWIDKNRSKIIRSRVYDHHDNKKQSNVHIRLDTTGNAVAKFRVQNQGVFFDEIMIYQNAPADYIKDYNTKKFSYSDFAIGDFSYKQASRDVPLFDAEYTLSVRGMARVAGEKLVLPNIPTIPLNDFFSFDDVSSYASIRRGMTVVDDIEIDLPEGVWIYNKPERDVVESKFGTYTVTTEIDGSKLRVRREFTLYKGEYTRGDFTEFREFHRKLERIENRKLVLNGKT